MFSLVWTASSPLKPLLGTPAVGGGPLVAKPDDILVNLWSTSALARPVACWHGTSESRPLLRPLAHGRVLGRHGKEGVNGSSPLEGFTFNRMVEPTWHRTAVDIDNGFAFGDRSGDRHCSSAMTER